MEMPEEVAVAFEAVQAWAAENGKRVRVENRGTRKRAKRPEVVVLEAHEMGRLLATPDLRYMTQLRNAAVMHLMAETGLRIGEALALKEDSITLEGDIARVSVPDEEGAKVGHRVVYFRALRDGKPVRSWVVLSKWMEKRYGWSTYLFDTAQGTPLAYLSFLRALHRYVEKAGIEKDVTPHTFRRTYATMLAREGIEPDAIRALMGHTDVATTAIYWSTDEKRMRDVVLAR